jgi:hypothetical protein
MAVRPGRRCSLIDRETGIVSLAMNPDESG